MKSAKGVFRNRLFVAAIIKFFSRGFRTMTLFILLLLSSMFLAGLSFAQGGLKLPPSPSPEHYSTVFMARPTKEKNAGPVVFSHFIHRVKFTCRVCHYELEFSMKANDTPIQCDNGKMNGRYCAACHNGKISFGPEDENGKNCSRCHLETKIVTWKKFYEHQVKKLHELQEKLPKSKFGNEINWSKALDEGLIKPKNSLSASTMEIVNIKTFTIEAQMSGISSAVFPHKTHEQWLDCSSCHPELFNIKKKSTESLRMSNMLEGDSCGVCHLHVAFPLDSCKRCHPKMHVY